MKLAQIIGPTINLIKQVGEFIHQESLVFETSSIEIRCVWQHSSAYDFSARRKERREFPLHDFCMDFSGFLKSPHKINTTSALNN